MKLQVSCLQCPLDALNRGGATKLFPVPDTGVVRMVCDSRHETLTKIQQEKFELLSEMAVWAIVDGYYRDAVVSFASSLERLYEFYTKATLRVSGISREDVELLWKPLKGSSERQLGLFVGAYAMANGTLAPLLGDKMISFRNRIVHNGGFPSLSEAIQFGQAVADIAGPLLMHLQAAEYEEVTSAMLLERYGGVRYSPDGPEAGLSLLTIFSLITSCRPIDVAASVEEHQRRFRPVG